MFTYALLLLTLPVSSTRLSAGGAPNVLGLEDNTRPGLVPNRAIPVTNQSSAPTINIMAPAQGEHTSNPAAAADLVGELGHAVGDAQQKVMQSRQGEKENAELFTLKADEKASEAAENLIKIEEDGIATDRAKAAKEEAVTQAEKRRHTAAVEGLDEEQSEDEKNFALESRALRSAIGSEEKAIESDEMKLKGLGLTLKEQQLENAETLEADKAHEEAELQDVARIEALRLEAIKNGAAEENAVDESQKVLGTMAAEKTEVMKEDCVESGNQQPVATPTGVAQEIPCQAAASADTSPPGDGVVRKITKHKKTTIKQ